MAGKTQQDTSDLLMHAVPGLLGPPNEWQTVKCAGNVKSTNRMIIAFGQSNGQLNAVLWAQGETNKRRGK